MNTDMDVRDALAAMTEAEIRRAQDLVHAQQRMAHEHNNTRALEALNDWDNQYADEMIRRLLA